MPRNRRPRDREEKSAEIVAAAATLFTDVGFEKTSLVSVAKVAGVTTNTIYWYFESKEALLVAVLDHLLAEALHGVDEQAETPLVDRLLWVVGRLDERAKLVTTVHALATTSPVVEAWHDGFHAVTNEILADGLRQSGIPEEQVVPMTRLGVFAIEGLLMHPLPEAEQRAVLRLALDGPR
ncbi:TetR/AcrR family transcriptional regulator [Aeromicrobium chenweiae]|uniref:TetR family transcriptional regulator n=1 Tax=Aeromicrobium chenweiae TaxID=2079793 RepID=A0A2S0WLQ4_9ACTN|nr:TetR/AcrR family transcriptional regulator [Aeromicrobium chenweiae]AWB92273.1 TetR family transcriptional regulator [Aeromicrobium chenweiae]TGN31444.1 TetR/AcrR family transcriptional regulator [Aeromicrobium chenweiae]